MNRRAFMLGGASVGTIAITRSAHAIGVAKRLVCYVGSWTEGRGGVGGNGGIHVLDFDSATGSTTLRQTIDPQVNAGYLAVAPDANSLCVADERRDFGGQTGAGGGVRAYALDRATGLLTFLNAVPSLGANPAFVSIDASGRRAAVANHASYEPVVQLIDGKVERRFDDATVALFDIGATGILSPAVATATLDPGAGPTPEPWTGLPQTFAASPHAHSANWDPSNRWLLVCDKGADRIYTFRPGPGALTLAHRFEARPGSSPRHSAFHPTLPLVFVINEQGPTLGVYRFDRQSGSIEHLQTVSTTENLSLPEKPVYIPADVQVHATRPFAYATTRRADTIAVYRISTAPFALERIQVLPSGGQTPRSCAIDPTGRFLFAANQDSGYLSVFRIDQVTGQLTSTGQNIRLPKPVCIKFAMI